MNNSIKNLIQGMVNFEEANGSGSIAVKLNDVLERVYRKPMTEQDELQAGEEIANIYFEYDMEEK